MYQQNPSNDLAGIGSGIWFTEQSENKIGFIDLDKVIPISLSVNPKVISLRNGNNSIESIEISINKSDPSLDFQKQIQAFTNNGTIFFKPIISGTFVPNGDLMGMRVSFDPEIFEIKSQELIENETTFLGKIDVTLERDAIYTPRKLLLDDRFRGPRFFYFKESRIKYLRLIT